MKQDLEQVQGWLRMLVPLGTPGMVWIGSKSTNFRGARFHPHQTQDMLAEVRKRDRDPGVFLRMTTIQPQSEKRGTAEDSVAMLALWADIDIDGPGHKHDPGRYEGRKLPPGEEEARGLVSHLPEPSAWVRSGGGLYPFWLPAKPWILEECPDLAELSADLQESIGAEAIEQGYHYGTGVGDVARILRIPGTVNRKVPGDLRMCEIEWGGGPRYSYEELRAAIPVGSRRGPTGPPAPRPAPPVLAPVPPIPVRPRSRIVAPAKPEYDASGPGPFDEFAARNDLDQLLQSDGWTFAYEIGGRRHYARPGKHPKDGVSGNVYIENGRQVLYVFSEAAGLPTFRGLSVGEWYAWRYHGGDLRTAGQTLRRAGYGAPPQPAPMAPTTRLSAPGRPQQPAPGTPTPGTALVPVANVAEEVWELRPILRAIRALARRRMVGPWAVLGGVLAHAACRIGPHVVLPPIIGGRASLNLFVGMVGRSGAGKGAAMAVAAEFLGIDGQTPTHEAGTGQGIDASYTAQTKEGPVQYNDTALFTLAEIDTLAAHGQMNGATLMPTIRKLYSGEALGAQYADKFKRRPVRAHHYRAAMIAGIQPLRSGVLLDDADGGTPQRWLWLPVGDPGRRRSKKAISPPLQGGWWQDYEVWAPYGEQPEGEPVGRKEEVVVQVCHSAIEAIVAARVAALLDETGSDALQGHALLTQLKVAALLGFLDRRAEASEEDWALAGRIMTKSVETRTWCQNELAGQASERNRAKARAEGERAVISEEVQHQRTLERVQQVALRKLQKTPGEWVTRKALSQALGRDRAHLGVAVAGLVEAGLAQVLEEGTTTRYRTVTG